MSLTVLCSRLQLSKFLRAQYATLYNSSVRDLQSMYKIMTELLTDGSNRGVLFDRFQFTLFKQIVQANPPFSVLQEKVITDYYGIMIHTNSFMFAPTNKKVVQFVESGMAQFLVDKYRYINKFTDDEGPQVLTLDHLDAGFYVWLVCVVFSIFAFIVEIIVHKIKTRHQ